MRVTADFGASYLIDGGRFVNLKFFLKYLNEYGDFTTEIIYNIVTAPDERAEDAFYVRAVWDWHLRSDGSKVFDPWLWIILQYYYVTAAPTRQGNSTNLGST